MMMNRSFFLKIPLVLFFLVSTTFAKQSADSLRSDSGQNHKFDPTRVAKKDVQDAIRLARQTHKRILLDVGGEWCIWCHRLDSLFLQNKDLAEYLNKHYVVVKVNVSKENRNEEFLSRYPKVAGYPHIFVLDKNGKLLHSQDTGELEFPKNDPVKGHDEKKVFHFLKQWTE
jgi:thioredoxin-related protein